jgi:uncharacterized membrane protein HdeD (DUF308 family)
VNLRTIGYGLAAAVGLTFVKGILQALTDIHATDTSPIGWQILDRAVPAFAGVFLGVWPATVEGLLTFDFRATAVMAGSAALAAVLAYFGAPAKFVIATRNGDGSFSISSLPR